MAVHENRRLLQFSLKALFGVVLVSSLPLGCVAFIRHQAADFRRAEAPFKELSNHPVRATGDGAAMLRGRGGIIYIDLGGTALDDAKLARLKEPLEELPSASRLN